MNLTRKLLFAGMGLFYTILQLHAQPVITNQPTSQTNLPGTSVTFSVGINGAGPFTYQWQFNGTNLPNLGIITTVAGHINGNYYDGDGVAATSASVYLPYGVGFDSSGNLFIADTFNNRVRRVDTNGIISTVAGIGPPESAPYGGGYAGDGGAATNASLHFPSDVALDPFGNLFIADSPNSRIRKVDSNGIIMTVAGNGTSSYSGDSGAATNACLNTPFGVACDAHGNLFIADTHNSRIRKVDTNGIIITVAGGGSGGDGGAATNASLNFPTGAAFDSFGNLFIADSNNSRIRKVDTNGIITTVAGGGSGGGTDGLGDGGAATNASLNGPWRVALDANGNLFIGDLYNNRVRKVDTDGIITTVAGGGSGGDGGAATNASLHYPNGVAIDAYGNLFIADEDNDRIREVTLAGYPTLTLNNIGVTNAGNYSLVVTSPYGSVTTVVVTLTVAAPGIITSQPASQAVAVGSSPSFSAAVAGSGPFVYEWYFAVTNLVQSGTNNTLTLPNVSTNNAGNYTVVVTNNYGSVTSQIATLLVGILPALTTQPTGQTNLPGTTASFKVTAGGAGPLTYQWQFNGTNLLNNIIMTVAGNGQSYPPYAGGYNGDGILATYASLFNPSGVAFDAYGNLFIADTSNNRIRKVDTHGIITTVAGNGSAAYTGDGGAATSASLYRPSGVAFDAIGNLFIADRSNQRIRKVDTNGVITTLAGNGNAAYAGDGGAATNASLKSPGSAACDPFGNLFFADTGNHRIRIVDTNGTISTVAGNGIGTYAGDGGAATNASLSSPSSVAFGASGNLDIADSANNRIRQMDTNGIITTVAGNGIATYSGDGGAATNASLKCSTLYSGAGVAFDACGNLFIADPGNHRIRKVDSDGIITTVAGKSGSGNFGDGGAATNAKLNYPSSVAFDPSGNLYIADTTNNRIRKVWLYAAYPTLTLNNIGAINAGDYSLVVTGPFGSVTSMVATLTVPAPAVITRQPASQLVMTGGTPGFSVAVAGSGPFGYGWYFAGTNLVQSGTNNTLTLPNVSTNNAGNYTVVITNNYGSVTSQVATLSVLLPIQPASLTNLAGTTVTLNAAVNKTGPLSYQWQFNGTNLPNNIITTVAGGGAGGGTDGVGDGGSGTNASLWNPVGVTFDACDNLFIADIWNNRIRKVDTNGIITTVAGGATGSIGDGGAAPNASLHFPQGVAFDAYGNMFIADYGWSRIRKVDTSGIITTVAGNGTSSYSGDGGAATNATLNSPIGVRCDALGNIFVADTYNNRIRKVDTNGIITTVAGNGIGQYAGDGGAATNARLNNPQDVAFDSFGNMFIADWQNSRIRKVDTNGIITSVAGNGSATYAGDGGVATSASLRYPSGLAFDTYGNLFIADYNNQRIRKVDTHGIITTVAGNGSATYAGDGGAATNASLYQPQRVACDAAGNVYIGDSLNNRVREVHLAGYPSLALNNIAATNAGNYTVVISSPYGSITSLVATLTVIVPPQIIASGTNFGFTTNLANQSGFGFNISGTVGQTIVVDGSTNLLDWTPLHTNTANGLPTYFFDPTSTNFPGRFYRARLSQ